MDILLSECPHYFPMDVRVTPTLLPCHILDTALRLCYTFADQLGTLL
jgi:hypothetical protein